MYKPQQPVGQQPAVESYPEVVEPGHVYQHPYNAVDPYSQKSQHPAPDTWGQLEVGVPPAPTPVGGNMLQNNMVENNMVESNTGEKAPETICGVKKRTFWILVVVLALAIILGAVGGGVGATLASKDKTPATATFTNNVGSGAVSTGISATGDISTPTSIPTSTALPTENGIEAQGQAVRAGLTATRFKAESDKWTPLGYQLTSVSGYSFGITDVYAAIWELKVGPTVAAEKNLNSSQYQTDVDDMGKNGYYPILVDAWTVNGEDRYGAIWLDSEGKSIPAWATKFDQTKTQFQTEHDKRIGQGYCIKCLSGYAVGTEARYTALWNECPDAASNSTVLKYAVLPSQLQAQLNSMVALGYRVSYVNGYALSNQAYYDLIYTLGSGSDWFMMYGMNATRTQEKLDDMGGQSYKVTVLSGYTINNNFLYSVIWDR